MKSNIGFAVSNTVTTLTEKTSHFALVGQNFTFIPVDIPSLNKDIDYLFGVGGTPPFSPTDIPGLNLWLDFSNAATLFQDSGLSIPVTTNGQPIGGIVDQSGSSNNMLLTSGTRPTYTTNAQNGHSVGAFNGTTDFLESPNNLVPTPATTGFNVFLVVAPSVFPNIGLYYAIAEAFVASLFTYIGPGDLGRVTSLLQQGGGNVTCYTNQGIWTINVCGMQTVLYDSSQLTNDTKLRQNFNGLPQTLSFDGSADLLNTSGSSGIGTTSQANPGYAIPFAGNFCELIMYGPNVLTSGQITQVETYLINKWGL
jgi:hypothetical protein